MGAHYENVCSFELKEVNDVDDETIAITMASVKLNSNELDSLREKYFSVHYRYGHVEIDKLIQTAKIGKLDGLTLQECYKVKAAEIGCIACDKAKIKHLPVNVESKRPESTVPLEMVCVDVLDLGNIDVSIFKDEYVSPFKPIPEYVSGIIDDKSKFVDLEPSVTKDESENHVIKFLKLHSNATEDENGNSIPLIHTTVQADGAYKTTKLQSFCDNNGFRLSIVPPHTHHNVYIEQFWRVLLKALRAAFEVSNAPLFTIGYVIKACNFNLNQLIRPNGEETKFEGFYHRPPRKGLIHTPLCDVVVAYEPGEKVRSKLVIWACF